MGLFGNSASQTGPPVQAVMQLRSQGRSDHEIIDDLSTQGYSSIDIYNALNQADQSAGPAQPATVPDATSIAPQPSAGAAAQPMQPQDPWGGAPNQAQDPWAQPQASPDAQNQASSWGPQDAAPEIVHSAPSQPQAPPQQPSPPPAPIAPQAPVFGGAQAPSPQAPVFGGNDASLDQIDQVAEAIIDEKWQQLKAYVEKIVDWKAKVEQRIVAIEQNQKMLDEQIVGLQKSLVEKVQTYDRHITDVGTEIKAMEKVFQKIIPSLTDNVNELSSVVHRMKDEQ